MQFSVCLDQVRQKIKLSQTVTSTPAVQSFAQVASVLAAADQVTIFKNIEAFWLRHQLRVLVVQCPVPLGQETATNLLQSGWHLFEAPIFDMRLPLFKFLHFRANSSRAYYLVFLGKSQLDQMIVLFMVAVAVSLPVVVVGYALVRMRQIVCLVNHFPRHFKKVEEIYFLDPAGGQETRRLRWNTNIGALFRSMLFTAMRHPVLFLLKVFHMLLNSSLSSFLTTTLPFLRFLETGLHLSLHWIMLLFGVEKGVRVYYLWSLIAAFLSVCVVYIYGTLFLLQEIRLHTFKCMK